MALWTSSDRLDLGVGLSHRAAIHNSLAIAPADADPRWYFARRSGSSQGA
jgi:hypothetical protein